MSDSFEVLDREDDEQLYQKIDNSYQKIVENNQNFSVVLLNLKQENRCLYQKISQQKSKIRNISKQGIYFSKQLLQLEQENTNIKLSIQQSEKNKQIEIKSILDEKQQIEQMLKNAINQNGQVKEQLKIKYMELETLEKNRNNQWNTVDIQCQTLLTMGEINQLQNIAQGISCIYNVQNIEYPNNLESETDKFQTTSIPQKQEHQQAFFQEKQTTKGQNDLQTKISRLESIINQLTQEHHRVDKTLVDKLPINQEMIIKKQLKSDCEEYINLISLISEKINKQNDNKRISTKKRAIREQIQIIFSQSVLLLQKLAKMVCKCNKQIEKQQQKNLSLIKQLEKQRNYSVSNQQVSKQLCYKFTKVTEQLTKAKQNNNYFLNVKKNSELPNGQQKKKEKRKQILGLGYNSNRQKTKTEQQNNNKKIKTCRTISEPEIIKLSTLGKIDSKWKDQSMIQVEKNLGELECLNMLSGENKKKLIKILLKPNKKKQFTKFIY